jgi:hypothetical protein
MVYYISAMPLRSQRPLHVKEMPVISINRLGDTKRIIRKMGGGGWGGGAAQGVADQKQTNEIKLLIGNIIIISMFSIKTLNPGGNRSRVFCSWGGGDVHSDYIWNSPMSGWALRGSQPARRRAAPPQQVDDFKTSEPIEFHSQGGHLYITTPQFLLVWSILNILSKKTDFLAFL